MQERGDEEKKKANQKVSFAHTVADANWALHARGHARGPKNCYTNNKEQLLDVTNIRMDWSYSVLFSITLWWRVVARAELDTHLASQMVCWEKILDAGKVITYR